MNEPLLDKRTSEALFARSNGAARSPPGDDVARSTGQSQETPRTAAAQESSLDESDAFIDAHDGPDRYRSSVGRWGQGHKSAHVAESFTTGAVAHLGCDRMGCGKGEMMTPDTLTEEETVVEEVEDAEELLVEEVSIDGLCGVY